MRRLGLAAVILALVPAAPAGAAIELHAHRGATLAGGVPVTPENSMRAFRRAAPLVDKLEIDVKLTSDRVPVIMHDPTLDRTTDCSGPVSAISAAELESCHIDILGTSGNFVQLASSHEPVPTLEEFLAFAVQRGAGVNLELKNLPTEFPEFDATPAYANTVLDVVEASGIARDKIQVQSFWPLDVNVARDAGYKTSLLTQQPLNEPAIAFSTAMGYDAVGPQWPPLTPVYVDAAQAAGLEVIPYTLNTEQAMRDAAAAGVDGVISDDLQLMHRVLRSAP